MWNSCAMEFMNNLLKINLNGKLRTEISSADLCSQWVTRLHKSAPQNSASGAALLAASPQEPGSSGQLTGSGGGAALQLSAWLQSGFCFWKTWLWWVHSGRNKKEKTAKCNSSDISPLHCFQQVIKFWGRCWMLSLMSGKLWTLPSSAL